jgi:signal transduction histidine kinase
VLNACEAVDSGSGGVEVSLGETPSAVEIKIADNGRGIPGRIESTLFEPFVSQGKENGTGLGLTVVQKIIQDHGGTVRVERTSPEGTVFSISLPRPAPTPSTEDSSPATEASVNSTKPA